MHGFPYQRKFHSFTNRLISFKDTDTGAYPAGARQGPTLGECQHTADTDSLGNTLSVIPYRAKFRVTNQHVLCAIAQRTRKLHKERSHNQSGGLNQGTSSYEFDSANHCITVLPESSSSCLNFLRESLTGSHLPNPTVTRMSFKCTFLVESC